MNMIYAKTDSTVKNREYAFTKTFESVFDEDTFFNSCLQIVGSVAENFKGMSSYRKQSLINRSCIREVNNYKNFSSHILFFEVVHTLRWCSGQEIKCKFPTAGEGAAVKRVPPSGQKRDEEEGKGRVQEWSTVGSLD